MTTVARIQASQTQAQEETLRCQSEKSPPTNVLETNLWLNLPLPNRQRLIWILSQMLENQIAAQLQQEQSHES
ncbi:MAG: hypothetical protein HC860_03235 [Alkalinema sp. RU_4_3]|nr:hypothetical protein [Alkalinema sp. RU_4_3]